jgi:hypothetical protein
MTGTKIFIVSLFTALNNMCCFYNSVAAVEEPPGIIKTGWTLGAMPSLAFSPDRGLKYGGIVNLFYFGDGSVYPKYMHSIYSEISGYTKGGGNYRLFYDSGYIIPNIRLTSDISYFTDNTVNFYGFNGYNSFNNGNWANDPQTDISSVFYNLDRSIYRFTLNFQGPFLGKNLRWIGGAGLLKYNIGTVDIDRLNKDREDKIADIPTLYDKYIEWGLISDKEKNGGNAHHFRFGIIYDTRDNEPNPMSGMWTEVVIFSAPRFMGNGDYAYSRLSATHRQYFTLVENRLSLVYRLNYQGPLGGTVPFYMLPYQINSFSRSSSNNGPGGSNTIRGISSNTIIGEGLALGNLELRWKFYRTVLFNQNFYLAFNNFMDAGQVVINRKIEVPADSDFYNIYQEGKETMHVSLGGGLRVAMNENFIYALDYGKPIDKRDGGGGLHIGMNYLF